jgi:DNA-binding PadR family transcriptional regulator
LVALADRDLHGYAIMQDVSARTNGKLRLSPGTLYGSIKRLLEQGLIIELENDARRRYYRLTPFGRKVVKAEAARLMELVAQARQYGFAG